MALERLLKRALDQTFSLYFRIDDLRNEVTGKSFTPYYKGKPTKRYTQIPSKLEQAKIIKHKLLEEGFKRAIITGSHCTKSHFLKNFFPRPATQILIPF